MSLCQLNVPLPVLVLGKGKSMSLPVIDYGPQCDLIWITALDDMGETWCPPNPTVPQRADWTMGRSPPIEVDITSDEEKISGADDAG